MDCKITLCLS